MLKNYSTACFIHCLLLGWLLLATSCNMTKHLAPHSYLLQKNAIAIKSDRTITNKGELSSQLEALVIQKPNSKMFGFLPIKTKLLRYNNRYKHYQKDAKSLAFQLKNKVIEKPVVYDSVLKKKTEHNMYNFLFNQGYFYAQIKDTTTFKENKKRAFIQYKINTGQRYFIKNTSIVADDTTIEKLLNSSLTHSELHAGTIYTKSLADMERSRLTNLMRNQGYYNFTQDNISNFVLDTLDKSFLTESDNLFETALKFVTTQTLKTKRSTLDVQINVRSNATNNAYKKYKISTIEVYPDFQDTTDFYKTNLNQIKVKDVVFKAHNNFIRNSVLYNQILFQEGEYFSQQKADATITKLNEIGLFQFVRLYFIEENKEAPEPQLKVYILLNPIKKYDISPSIDITNGSTYAVGSSVSINYRDHNFLKGANQLSISLSGGIEMGYFKDSTKWSDKFPIRSRNEGLNASLDCPKFIAPNGTKWSKKQNAPHTIFSIGINKLNRVDYYKLTNINTQFAYNWKATNYITWGLTPSFINIFNLPQKDRSTAFEALLNSNSYLRNSYQEKLIEGEQLSYQFTNQNSINHQQKYAYLKATIEEAGGVLSLVNYISRNSNSFFKNSYSKYIKFDLDSRQYFNQNHSTLAMKFYGGIGIPIDGSATLPYVKQYYVGGAYSLRGWRVRSLGPGSFVQNDTTTGITNLLDRTGDIKLEGSVEYRFDIVPLFSGGTHLNGALFLDGGNIWLAKASSSYPGGEFQINKFVNDIAINGGLGARLDIGGLFVVRLDAAFPLKYPYMFYNNSSWNFQDFNPLKSEWRAKNMVYNIAIGYPF